MGNLAFLNFGLIQEKVHLTPGLALPVVAVTPRLLISEFSQIWIQQLEELQVYESTNL